MADIKLSALASENTFANGDFIIVTDGTQDKKILATDAKDYFVSESDANIQANADDIEELQTEYEGMTYKAGDTFTARIWTGGFITNSTKSVCFSIPSSKAITASTVTLTSGTINVFQNGSIVVSNQDVTQTTLTVEATGAGIRIRCTFPSAISGATNNDACGIEAYNFTFTFS